jgi:hypothetical protein
VNPTPAPASTTSIHHVMHSLCASLDERSKTWFCSVT